MFPLKRTRRSTFTPPPTAIERQAVPVVSTLIASLLPIVPVIWEVPLLPPLGFMVFLGWAVMRGSIWPLWAGLPLGLADDLVSGSPIGTAMCGWTLALLALDALDGRLPFRTAWQDWAIVVVATGAMLGFALAIARFEGALVDVGLLGPQLLVGALVWPLVARTCAALDRWRSPRA